MFDPHLGGQVRFTRMTLAIALIPASLLVSAGKCGKAEPSPKPSKTLTVANSTVVEVCAETALLIRYEEHWCAEGESGYAWRYISDRGEVAELPAIGEVIRQKATATGRPAGKIIIQIPAEGAVFRRPYSG